MITLIEPFEFDELHIPQLPERARVHGLIWHGLPITDGAAPDERFLTPWRALGAQIVSDVLAGGRVAVHCKGGLGRAGTVAAMILLDSRAATSAEDAMRQVRAVRDKAIETVAQEQFLKLWQHGSVRA